MESELHEDNYEEKEKSNQSVESCGEEIQQEIYEIQQNQEHIEVNVTEENVEEPHQSDSVSEEVGENMQNEDDDEAAAIAMSLQKDEEESKEVEWAWGQQTENDGFDEFEEAPVDETVEET